MLGKKVYVFDNFIDLKYQEKIKNILMGDYQYKKEDFPWHYIEDVTAAGDFDSQHRAALSHEFVNYIDNAQMNTKQSCVVSKFHEFILPMLKSSCKKIGVNNIDILQGRSFLQFPLNLKDRSVDNPHRDLWDTNNFFVVLYYVCDSDGDTVIYNETEESDVYTLKQKVSPKEGRVVVFDGTLMHTAEQPLNNTRCVINYNLGLRY
jgi:hypothetical protein